MKKSKQLERWEVSLIKRMLANGDFNKQEILSYFSQPGRSINQARISEIAGNSEWCHGIRVASQDELISYLSAWRKVQLPGAPAGMLEKQSEEEFPDRQTLSNGNDNPLQLIEEIIGEFK